jgi:acetyl-CoA carboxylase alpha subunit
MIKILKENIAAALLKFEGLSAEELKTQRADKFEVLGFYKRNY